MRIFVFAGMLFASVLIMGVGSPTVNAQEEQQPKKKIVQVDKGDTLQEIAKENSTTYPRMFYANKQLKDPDIIYPGQRLRVPDGKEKLSKRPLGESVAVAQKVTRTTYKQYRTYSQSASSSSNRVAAASNVSGGVWDRLAACESGGNWSINTGNGYYGGLQFTQSSWRAVGGSGSPNNASKSEQIARAKMLQARQGWGAWPACTAKMGLR